MPRANRFLPAFLLIFLCQILFSQSSDRPNFRHLDKLDGLSQVSVFTIAKDSTGFMWFGTRSGLNRYDGYNFQVYTREEGLSNEDIRHLYVDPVSSSMWVAPIAGLNRYDSAKDCFVAYPVNGEPGALRDSVVLSFLCDSHDRLWVGTSLGLNLYDRENDNFHPVDFPEDIFGPKEKSSIRFIVEDERGSLWAGTDKGLFSLAPDATTWIWEEKFRNIAFSTGQYLGEGTFLLGATNEGLIRWNSNTGKAETFRFDAANDSSLSNDQVRTIAIDKDGGAWIGTFSGLNYLPLGRASFTRYYGKSTNDGPLGHSSIRSLLVDKTGKLWVGSYYGGVSCLDERYNYFKNYQHQNYRNSISSNVVSSFAEDPGGNIWIGTEGSGLDFFDREKNIFRQIPLKPPNQTTEVTNIKTLLRTEQTLWIGTFRAGMIRHDLETGEYRYYNKQKVKGKRLTSDNVYQLHQEDNKLWMLTYGGGLNIMDLETEEVRSYRPSSSTEHPINSNYLRTILKVREGHFWIGSEHGLNAVTTGTDGYPVNFKAVQTDKKIYALASGGQEGFWVGTYGKGLLFCDHKGREIKSYTTADGLPDNNIFGILKGRDGTLWISTGNGLSRFDLISERFSNFTTANGLQNLEFNFNAAYKTEDSTFFFGGINGFTAFQPSRFQLDLTPPPIVFTRLTQGGKTVLVTDEEGLLAQNINATKALVFPYGEAAFTLDFAALDFTSPENNQYAYMLEGLDRDWTIKRGKSQASYNLQKEGRYTFKLQGSNNDGTWNPEVRTIEIRVLPPAWRSWWAYLLYATAAGILLYLLVRYIRLSNQFEMQQIAQQQQDELLEAKLRFFTNITHEFRTPLTLIIGPIEQLRQQADPESTTGSKLGLIHRNAERLLRLVDQVMTFSKLDSAEDALQVEEHQLTSFAQEIFEAFRDVARLKAIDYQFIDRSEALRFYFDAEKIEKVLYNLLSNAFKFTEDGGKITLILERDANTATIRVVDNGPGIDESLKETVFQRFYEKPVGVTSQIKNSGVGLSFSRQIVELHQGRIYVGDTAAGAELIVELPIEKEVISFMTAQTETLPSSSVASSTTDDVSVSQQSPEVVPAPFQEGLLKKLLIVDDSEEIRQYLASIFANEYELSEAITGADGLKMARTVMPDLIISDVMMPEMDGLTFCHTLKNDIAISHIPIILLTARSGEPFLMEGLRTGADAYLTKPFNAEELRLRVTNLLKTRQRFQETFGKQMRLDPERIEVESVDKEFLEQVLAIAEREVANADYKVDTFARDMAVSRTLLFNKLKALTGQTPSKFLKHFRLKRAVQLLEDSDYRIQQIATMTGFRDERYFSECFKTAYGRAPLAFRQAKRK